MALPRVQKGIRLPIVSFARIALAPLFFGARSGRSARRLFFAAWAMLWTVGALTSSAFASCLAPREGA